jgi:hypothetical protein
MKTLKYLCIAAMTIALLGCQTVKPEKSAERVKPVPVQLMSNELNALFVNKTVKSFNRKTKVISLTYYHPDGRAIQKRDQLERTGFWKIVNNEICLSMEDKKYSCRPVYRVGKKYYKYKVKKSGKKQKLIRYRSFVEGNAL